MVKFILNLDSWLCVFNDLAVLIRESPWQQWLLLEIEDGFFSFVFSKENFDFSSWMNDWEGGEGMSELHHVYHGWESTGSAIYITVSNAGINLYLSLYPWIRELILKWLSLYFLLTLDYVFLTTSGSRFVRAHDNKDFFVKLKVNFFFCIFKREFLFFFLNEWLRGRGRTVSTPSCLILLTVNGFNRLYNGVEYRYRPLFTIIPLNSWINLEIFKFILYCDSWLCVFNDLAVSICESPWQQRLLCEIECGFFSFVFSKENFDFSY